MPKHHAKILKTYAGLLGLTACSYTLMYGPQPMFNLISWDLNVNKAHIGLLVSVFMLALSLAPLVVGLFLSRLGLRRAVFLACLILTLSGVGIYFSSSFSGLLLVRILQGILVPVVLTSVMAGIASLFRHLDLARALAGFVTASLLGSLAGRILGGLLATTFSWRLTLIGFGLLFTLGLYLTKNLPAKFPGQNKPHSLKDYLRVLKFKGLAPLLLIEACGIFTFAAIGNLIPLRLSELGCGQNGGFVGLMYLGYSVGLVATLLLNPLKRLSGSANRLLTYGATLYFLALLTLKPASPWALFGGLWLIALGEFIVHALTPGLINQLAIKNGEKDRGLVNGLFLSCYYLGGTLGSFIPGFIYAHLGWLIALSSMLLVQGLALFLVVTKAIKLKLN